MEIKGKIFLRKDREKSVERRHPWVFSGGILRTEGQLTDGDLVQVCDSKGKALALGHYHDGSITVKIIHFGTDAPGEDFWMQRIQNAFQLRVKYGIANALQGNAFRLIHGEGDELPGLIADVYDRTLVLQAHSIGMHKAIDKIAEAALHIPGLKIDTVYDKSRETLPAEYALHAKTGFISGAEADAIITEHGIKYHIDVVGGQKTGFFLDQRDNRQLLATYARDRTVLNTFCYSGGFSLAAAKAGAQFVHSVDVSAAAIQLTEQNAALNGIGQPQHQAFKQDVQSFMKNCNRAYDIVVLDPPAFAKSISKRHNAVQGYKRLNLQGIERVKPGGLLFTFSCSQVVDMPLFQHTVTAAAIESGRPARILHRLSQPPDHPVNIYHPEGSYLKGLVLEIG